jgi:hypothetical protein
MLEQRGFEVRIDLTVPAGAAGAAALPPLPGTRVGAVVLVSPSLLETPEDFLPNALNDCGGQRRDLLTASRTGYTRLYSQALIANVSSQ